LISRTVLDADVVISLPKLKTHKKVGLTASMKNLVGINGNKNWLPHHREGSPSRGGDQFEDDGVVHRLERVAVSGFKRVFPSLGPLRPVVARSVKALGTRVFGDTNTDTIRSGNWYGNDTTWRMVIDLNRILLYADTDGVVHDRPVRRVFSVVDAIVAGEGNGPLDATPKAFGVILAGANPVAVDLACARVMGFDFARLPMLFEACEKYCPALTSFAASAVTVRPNHTRLVSDLGNLRRIEPTFVPHFGWRNHIECLNGAVEQGEMEAVSGNHGTPNGGRRQPKRAENP
jgi:hypothetical protein